MAPEMFFSCSLETGNFREVGHASHKVLHLEPWDCVQPRYASVRDFLGAVCPSF